MAIKGKTLTINFLAWDTGNSVGKTGDSGNFTLRLIKDGGVATQLTNHASVTEPDSTNLKGIYEITLTATEMTANMITFGGVSSTADIVIYPLFFTTERGDLSTVDTVVDGIKTVTDALPDAGVLSSLAQDNTVAKEGADSDTLETLSDQLDGVQTSVNGISNVTRLTVALPTYMERTDADKAIKIEVALKDTDGNMEDPDGNQLALTVYNSAGISRDALLYKDAAFANGLDSGAGTFSAYKKLEKSATGLYCFYYKLEPAATEEELIFKFGWEEGSAALYEYRSSQVMDAANDLSAIKLQTDKMNFTGDDIKATLDSEKVQVSGVDTDVINAAALKADAVTEIQSGLATSTEVGNLNNVSTSEVKTQCDQALADYDPATHTELTAALTGLNDPTAAAIVSAIMDKVGWTKGGTTKFSTAIAAMYARMFGDTATTQSGEEYTSTYKEVDKPADTRAVMTQDLDGNRDSVTVNE